RAVGVEVRVNGADRIAQVRGEVILAAGAIGSPHLLELSGIGRPEHLRTLGIDVVHALSGLGENLQDHLQLRLIYKLKHALTLNTLSASLLGKARIGLEYLLKRSGPMSMAPSQLGAFAKSDPSLETPDLEYHVQPLSLDRFGEPLHPFPAITASVCNLRPESRGSVHAATPNFTDAPAIRPNYLSTAGDRRVAAAAIRLTRGIMRQAPMAAHEPEEYRPRPAFQRAAELTQAAGQVGPTIFHPLGTAG